MAWEKIGGQRKLKRIGWKRLEGRRNIGGEENGYNVGLRRRIEKVFKS